MTRIYVTETHSVEDTYLPDWEGPRHAGYFTLESAQRWAGDTRWDGHNNVDINVGGHRGQHLYRTAQGRWVLSTWSNWQGAETVYVYADENQAQDWLLFNGHDDVAQRYFGEPDEERGPGRPGIGGRVDLRLGELLPQVEQWATDHGVTQAKAVRELLTSGLTAARELEQYRMFATMSLPVLAALLDEESTATILPNALPWTRSLPEADRNEFAREMMDVVTVAHRLDTVVPIVMMLVQWQHTAEAHANPDLHHALTTDHATDHEPTPSAANEG